MINKNGKMYAWGTPFQSTILELTKGKPSQGIIDLMLPPEFEGTKFKRVMGTAFKYAAITFTDDLFTFGVKYAGSNIALPRIF